MDKLLNSEAPKGALKFAILQSSGSKKKYSVDIQLCWFLEHDCRHFTSQCVGTRRVFILEGQTDGVGAVRRKAVGRRRAAH